MKRSRPNSRPELRGATRVSIAWLITFLALFFVALFIAYAAFDGEAKAEKEAEEARTAKSTAEDLLVQESKQLTALSTAVGFYDPAQAAARTDVALIATALDELLASFPAIKREEVKALADALPGVKQAYAEANKALASETKINEELKGSLETTRQAHEQALREKDKLISDQARQLADEQGNATQKQAELESRIAALTSQRNDLDAEGRKLRAQLDDQRRQYDDEVTAYQTRLRNLASKLAFLDEPESPDAQLLAVSKELDLGWIDIGARNRLAQGTTFSVVSGATGSSRIKAMATVTKVEADSAEVLFHDIPDRFDPPVPGDKVFNPLYDPHGQRTAVLAGRFSGLYNEGELKVLLAAMGIQVQAELGDDTDYLIVGSDLFADPETGEPLEDPMPVSELSVYKDAESNGTLIVPIKSLRDYFKL